MIRYVSLRVRKLPLVHWFAEPRLILEPEQKVLIQTTNGLEVATVLRMLPEGRTVNITGMPFIKEIIRALTPKDKEMLLEISDREKDAFKRSKLLVEKHKLPMKLLKSEYLFDYSRLILYYKADRKVDFRELLKSLAAAFRTRIELRQIGVRDETKLLGGIGCCGKTVCCAQFLHSFHPVSTKMAKDQNLGLNPTKLSGMCSRLLCCLSYEHAHYLSFHGKCPKLGSVILIGEEIGWVNDINYISEKMAIALPDRRKIHQPLGLIKVSKDPNTGRNLWWVNDPNKKPPEIQYIMKKTYEFESDRSHNDNVPKIVQQEQMAPELDETPTEPTESEEF
ncbi:MAG: stage 0 sporulation protein [Candidatus Riflebacteria bacterium]|nr:stage 0 sporulation protein [Candidatus Riflebacteria bacterium]